MAWLTAAGAVALAHDVTTREQVEALLVRVDAQLRFVDGEIAELRGTVEGLQAKADLAETAERRRQLEDLANGLGEQLGALEAERDRMARLRAETQEQLDAGRVGSGR